VSLPKGAANLLANNDSAQSGRNHRVALDRPQFIREPGANISRDSGMLEEQSALEKLPAMQAGAQHEMSIEERACLAEKRKQIFAHADLGGS
jgi:hypothetical protein